MNVDIELEYDSDNTYPGTCKLGSTGTPSSFVLEFDSPKREVRLPIKDVTIILSAIKSLAEDN